LQLQGDYKKIFDLAINDILRGIKTDLSEFGVEYQQWFCEQTLVDSGLSEKTVKKLQDSGHIYEKAGALWFKTNNANKPKSPKYPSADPHHSHNIHCQLQNQPPAKD
jgi:arginyl-tRNA synthetase